MNAHEARDASHDYARSVEDRFLAYSPPRSKSV